MCLLLCLLYQCKQIICACVCVLEKAKHSFFALPNPLSCSVMNKICLNQAYCKVLVMKTDAFGTFLNRTITAQWKGMGDVGSVRYEPVLLPPCPTIRVLRYSNCQRSTHSISK